MGPGRTRKSTHKAILAWKFYVYGQPVELRPAIDWAQDPFESRTWRYELHNLTWLKEALARHAGGGDVETLSRARDVALDWAAAHLRDEDSGSEFAWYDMAVGLRAPYIGYALRACLAEDVLDDEGAALLLEAAQRHGAELAAGESYAEANNHGLFQDEGLYLLARQLPALPAADAWRELALTRMRSTLRATVSFDDGAHLEHSPAYQLAIVDLVARLATNVAELPELGQLLDRMRHTAAWQTTPSGRMPQLGDTDDLPAPKWARDAAGSLRGLRALFEAGQAFAREDASYLAVTAAYHGNAHKHADDGSLLLVEDGRVVLGDSGRWGYYEREADRLYARSALAHNVLLVDDREFDWRSAEPYGSGLDAAGEAAGWYAIAVRNPLLAGQGVDHRRVILYRPKVGLVAIDLLDASAQHEYTRLFHFGPELEARQEGEGRIVLTAESTVGALVVAPADGAELSLAHGREQPRLGWAYRGDRERAPVWTAALRSRGEDAILAASVELGEVALGVSEVRRRGRRIELTLNGGEKLVVSLDARRAIVRA